MTKTVELKLPSGRSVFVEAAEIARTEYLEGTYKQAEQQILGEVFVAEQNLRSSKLLMKLLEHQEI